VGRPAVWSRRAPQSVLAAWRAMPFFFALSIFSIQKIQFLFLGVKQFQV
jgi:hypothetical protein